MGPFARTIERRRRAVKVDTHHDIQNCKSPGDPVRRRPVSANLIPNDHNEQPSGTLELPSPARAKFQSSVFTPASAVFDPFRQIDTAII
jgi:hypothetical protein